MLSSLFHIDRYTSNRSRNIRAAQFVMDNEREKRDGGDPVVISVLPRKLMSGILLAFDTLEKLKFFYLQQIVHTIIAHASPLYRMTEEIAYWQVGLLLEEPIYERCFDCNNKLLSLKRSRAECR